MLKLFTVTDCRSGQVVARNQPPARCAEAMGVSLKTFQTYCLRTREGTLKRWKIRSDDMLMGCQFPIRESDPETGAVLGEYRNQFEASRHAYCERSTMSLVVNRKYPYEDGIAPDGHRYDRVL